MSVDNPWQNELRGIIMRETRWPKPDRLEEIAKAFNTLLADFRLAVITSLRLIPKQVLQLDGKLGEIRQLVEQNVDKWAVARGNLTQVKYIFELNKASTSLESILGDLDDRVIEYLTRQLSGLRSIHDYVRDEEGGWVLKEDQK